uniref:LRAT domain-containing protein n=1 Tax=Panagrellus redivivus TaxID=6233 RepID=A0A7E4VUK8_PANRE
MDLEAGRNENFESYFKSVISLDIWNASAGNRLYGVTQSGQRFAVMLIINLCYFVHQVVEPHGDSFCVKPVVQCVSFQNENLAKEYMENTHKELMSQTEIHSQNDFDNCAATLLKSVWGREVYRIRDFDVDGNPFAVVLIKNFAYYSVISFLQKNGFTQPQVNMTKWFLLDEAERRLQIELKKLKGKKGLKKVEVELFYDVTKYKDVKLELLPIISNSSTEYDPYFAEFVEKSVLCSFRGEEVYRKYCTTDTGQRFCFVVSKINYYILHVVLEPYLQERFRGSVKNDIEMYSLTLILLNIKKRTDVDRFVSEKLDQIVDKLQSHIDTRALEKHKCTLQASSFTNLYSHLRRGDHLRRNLKVRRFNIDYHDGIYLGNGQVAHYTTNNTVGFFKSKGGSGPGIVTLQEFLNGEDTLVVSFYLKPSRSSEHVAQVAEFLINNRFWDKQYNLVSRNCQLFAYLCTTTKLEHKLNQKNEAKDLRGGEFLVYY